MSTCDACGEEAAINERNGWQICTECRRVLAKLETMTPLQRDAWFISLTAMSRGVRRVGL